MPLTREVFREFHIVSIPDSELDLSRLRFALPISF
ncbi:unnamed protein product [Rodentolepis nana]|uniref:Uncharacterized protein n=1 Tax=Rodentolepis nana TaxID=102285 RepID=A0A3P7S1N7_RODNA|nr:unnamed protein product [Rodentolepis nana]